MAHIKYIGNGPENGKVHIKLSDGTTGCGAIYKDNPEDWQNTSEKVTCKKNGCAN